MAHKPLRHLFVLWVVGILSSMSYAQNDSLQLSPSLQNLALKEPPKSFVQNYSYNAALDLYVYTVKVGEFDIRAPLTLTPEEYSAMVLREKTRAYINEKQQALSGAVEDPSAQNNLLPDFYVRSDLFETIFGGQTIQIVPQGSVGLDLGVRYQKSGNPSLSPRNQSSFGFDFDQRISLGLTGNIGSRLRINANYDTQSTFDFQNLIKLEFFPPAVDDIGIGGGVGAAAAAASRGVDRIRGLGEGYSGDEDGILQKLEVGNVSMPLNSKLIQGAQSLFGIKADLKFGNTNISAVVSEQRSQTQSVIASGDGTLEDFSLFALDLHFGHLVFTKLELVSRGDFVGVL